MTNKQFVDAIFDNNTYSLKKILEKNPKYKNYTDQFGDNALHLAAFLGHDEACKILIDNGVDVNSKNKDGETALEIALSMTEIKTAQLLIELGANISLVDLDFFNEAHKKKLEKLLAA